VHPDAVHRDADRELRHHRRGADQEQWAGWQPAADPARRGVARRVLAGRAVPSVLLGGWPKPREQPERVRSWGAPERPEQAPRSTVRAVPGAPGAPVRQERQEQRRGKPQSGS